MTNRTVVTTSWDDGHVQDMTLAALLQKYNVRGTFYIAPEDHEFAPADRLTDAQISQLSLRFEIGAHTVTHPRLPQVDDATAATEITVSKSRLEAIINGPITSFCYPGGEYRPVHHAQVAAAGFTYARTVHRFAFEIGPDPLTAPTTIHAYRHWSDVFRIIRFARFRPARAVKYLLNWDALAIALFDEAHQQGSTFHMWGHSWEIHRRHDWKRLEHVLAHISGRADVQYLTNGELL